ncbi:hypothetical protein POSPLADRAFT_1133806 [Postia placenta MAD-698-R-SB12]|uniref:Uncharacterized protein n=1 Tax=Postia placenta MAD-698-R-SB12 TaxID=670580 RepID=A0A1X6N8N7_9APHY|nr:hypothetical protein POSPLADRAFT_1133806 [Postia placenta MAD-698-R-SB12]OSX64872.1 hypothetical protein POSPLADRAFT_1133806 [Postia placenta MAD-698-R-SB12]
MLYLLAPLVALYRFVLQPVAPFAWFGLSFSLLDVAAAFRTCVALRQLKEQFHARHIAKKQATKEVTVQDVESRSFVRDVTATLMVVYGGEAVTAPALGIPCSFMISGAGPAFYAGIDAIVNRIPAIHAPSLETELPISILDGFTRAMLLCEIVPPMITKHAVPAVANSPWSLLVTSLVTANGGWFFVNMLSFLQPYSLSLTTPPEFLPYGWTATDLWCAPLVTGLYALLTHAQPFWADAHAVAMGWLGAAATESEKVQPVDPEYARALCAVVLAGMFMTRTIKTFSASTVKPLAGPKTKVQ